MARETERRSQKTRKRRQFKRPSENTTLLAGGTAAALLAFLPEGKISPELAAGVTAAIAVVPKVVSEFVSWFRSGSDAEEEKKEQRAEPREDRREDRRATDGEKRATDGERRSTDVALDLRDRIIRLETSVGDLKDKYDDKFKDLRDDVRAYTSNGGPAEKTNSRAKTTSRRSAR